MERFSGESLEQAMATVRAMLIIAPRRRHEFKKLFGCAYNVIDTLLAKMPDVYEEDDGILHIYEGVENGKMAIS